MDLEMPNWLAGLLMAIILAWAGWVSTSVISIAQRLSDDKGWSRSDHEQYARSELEKRTEMMQSIRDQINLLKVAQSNTSLSQETKDWLNARFEHITIQVSHVADTQRTIKEDLKEVEQKLGKRE